MPNMYRPSSAEQTIVVLRSYPTTTTIAAFGSDDGYAESRTEFADDETIMVAGMVGSPDSADLTGVLIAISVDGVPFGTTPLYGFDGTSNYYQLSLGLLTEGTHNLYASFPRTRV
jgi:hypothetical protein